MSDLITIVVTIVLGVITIRLNHKANRLQEVKLSNEKYLDKLKDWAWFKKPQS